MKFNNWIALKEADAARSLDQTQTQTQNPSIRLVDAPMSRAGFMGKPIPHRDYKPKNFDRYPFKPDESKMTQYLDKMRKIVRNDMLLCIEALAGYYGNDGIVKSFDNFLSDLEQQNIRL